MTFFNPSQNWLHIWAGAIAFGLWQWSILAGIFMACLLAILDRHNQPY